MARNITHVKCERCGDTSRMFDVDAQPGSKIQHRCCLGSLMTTEHTITSQETCHMMPTERFDWGATDVTLPDWNDMPESACCYSVTWRDVWLHMRNMGCTDEEIRPFIIRNFADIQDEITKLMDEHASEIRGVVARLASENMPKTKPCWRRRADADT